VTVPLLAALLVIGSAGFARLHYAALRDKRIEQAGDGATILALEGIHSFKQNADPAGLMRLPVGADSMVVKARVFGGDDSMGTYAVSLRRLDIGGFSLLATGRLVSGSRSMMCSVRGVVRLAASSGRISVGYDTAPMCNGARHRSTLTTQLES
jgi:hypothetical protein